MNQDDPEEILLKGVQFRIGKHATNKQLGGQIFADHQGTHQTAASTQAGIPELSLATGRKGHEHDQPDPAWKGDKLSRWDGEQMLQPHQGLSREVGKLTPDAAEWTPGIWLEEVEWATAL